MKRKRSLNTRLIVLFILSSMIPMMAINFISYYNSRNSLIETNQNTLIAARDLKKAQIEDFFQERMSDVYVLSNSEDVLWALEDIQEAYGQGGLNSDEYNQAVQEYEEYFNVYVDSYGYYDLFLISSDGEVIYTVAKESDLGENLVSGDLSDSGLANIYIGGLKETVIEDYEYYAPSDESAAFLGAPITDNSGAVVGVVALQISDEALNSIMTTSTGLGDTGETYLVGSDSVMRSDSIFSEENTLGEKEITTHAVSSALSGLTGVELIENSEGTNVYSAYAPLEIEGLDWVIIAEIEEAEIMEPVIALLYIMIITYFIILFVCTILAIFTGKSISKPINNLSKKLSQSTSMVSSASVQLASASTQLSEGASEQAASIEETSATMEETSSMVTNNALNTRQANSMSQEASAAAENGSLQMESMIVSMAELKKSSGDIAKIIKVINDIAFQTNMLALNAAVEAARAGDAGQGFAVVAEEVRNLALKSAAAAKDTSSIIDKNIELSNRGVAVSEQVGQALKEIIGKTDRVNKLMAEIMTASDEQARGTSQVTEAIGQMEKVVQQNAEAAEESAASADELESQAEMLEHIVVELNKLINGTKTKKAKKSAVDDEDISLTDDIQLSEDSHYIVEPNEIIPLEDCEEF